MRLRSEITFHELPPAFTCTPTVAAVLVKMRKPPGLRNVTCPSAVARIESVAALAPASDPPNTNEPTCPAAEARKPSAIAQSASAVTYCPIAADEPLLLGAPRKLVPAWALVQEATGLQLAPTARVPRLAARVRSPSAVAYCPLEITSLPNATEPVLVACEPSPMAKA